MDPYKNGDSTYNCAVFGAHSRCKRPECGCECHDKRR